MNYTLRQISADGFEPVTLQEAKDWLRLEGDEEDPLVAGLITAARQHAETFCRRSFTPGEVWQLTLDSFPLAVGGVPQLPEYYEPSEAHLLAAAGGCALELPMGPVTAITSVAYLDSAGVQQTLDPAKYSLLQDDSAKPRIVPAFASGWPATQQQAGAVVITFTAGLPVNETVKVALKLTIDDWYKRPEAEEDDVDTSGLPKIAVRLLWPHRILSL